MKRNTRNTLLFSVSCLSTLAGFAVACGDYSMPNAMDSTGSTSGGKSTTTGSSTTTEDSTTDGTSAGTTDGTTTDMSSSSGGGMPSTAKLPCEVLDTAGHECVSAHSTVRLIVPGYAGPLYQLDDGTTTMDIMAKDGYADGDAHREFCSGLCEFSIIYDQSGYGNHLTVAPPGSAKSTWANPVSGKSLPTAINGHSVFGMKFRPGQGYRAACNDCTYPEVFPSGVPIDDEPQTQYMITSQHDLINGCCFDYGNAETTQNNDGNGTMETVYFGAGVIWGRGSGNDVGPWVMADMENGLFPGWENGQDRNISTNTPLEFDFVTAVVVGDTQDKNNGDGRFALYGGDATSTEITEMYDGIRPEKPGYVPMQKQGSVILGIGGDNSDGDGGRFYEGVIALGAASFDTVKELQVAIADAKYGVE